MVFQKKDLIFYSISIFFTCAFIFFINLKLNFVGLTFFINLILIQTLILISNKKNISSFLFVYIFMLIFFVIIPWIQYSNSVVLWSNYKFDDFYYSSLNIIISFIVILFYFFYRVINIKYDYNNFPKELKIKIGGLGCIFLSFICLFNIFYLNNFNVYSLFFKVQEDFIFSSLDNVLMFFSRFLPLFVFLRYVTSSSNKSKNIEVILLLMVVLCAFPSAVSRFVVAYVYLPLALYYLTSLKNSKHIFIFFVLSIIIVFPFLEQFRNYNIGDGVHILPKFEFFTDAHFDAYQNFMEVIRIDFVSYGWQLLGVFLFFIPRNFWPDKPVGSGYQMALDQNYTFNNISMPFFAEGYISFGYLGIIVFVFSLAFFCKKIDTKLLNSNVRAYDFFVGVFYCAAIFFMMRGDLMSTFSYMIAGISAYKVAKII